jgi:hypothetical protein
MPRSFGVDLFVARTQPTANPPGTIGWQTIEIARLRAHMEDAYALVGASKYHDARLALQAARWGTPHPDVADPDAKTEAT